MSPLYELIILGLLMTYTFHGYLIAKIINDGIGPFAKASTGRIYPLLTKMETEGLVTSCEQQVEGRTHRVFKITELGRKRFHQLMMDTTSNPKDYQEHFLYKLTAIEHLEPGERLYLVDHYITYCQAHVLHQQAQLHEFVHEQKDAWTPLSGNLFREATEQRIRTWQMEADWARSLRDKVVAPSTVDH